MSTHSPRPPELPSTPGPPGPQAHLTPLRPSPTRSSLQSDPHPTVPDTLNCASAYPHRGPPGAPRSPQDPRATYSDSVFLTIPPSSRRTRHAQLCLHLRAWSASEALDGASDTCTPPCRFHAVPPATPRPTDQYHRDVFVLERLFFFADDFGIVEIVSALADLGQALNSIRFNPTNTKTPAFISLPSVNICTMP